MSTTTSRLALYKPADDGSEYVDVSTNLNANMDKLDAAIGFIPATSSTPPSSPFAGMARQDTDTGRAYFRNGANSAWIQILNASSTYNSDVVLVQGKKLGIGVTPTAVVDVVHTSTSDSPLNFKAGSDTNARVGLDWAGIVLGPGNTAYDAALLRTGVGALATVGDLTIPGDLNVSDLATFNDMVITGDLDVQNIINDLTIAGDLTVTGIGQAIRKWKAADTNRNTTVTVTDDPDLTMTLQASATYMVKFVGMAGAATASDVRTAWTVPSGATGLKYCLGPGSSATTRDDMSMRSGVHVHSSEIVYGISSTSLFSGFVEYGIVTTTSSGTLAIKWAQGTSGGTNTTMAAGSFMEAVRIA